MKNYNRLPDPPEGSTDDDEGDGKPPVLNPGHPGDNADPKD